MKQAPTLPLIILIGALATGQMPEGLAGLTGGTISTVPANLPLGSVDLSKAGTASASGLADTVSKALSSLQKSIIDGINGLKGGASGAHLAGLQPSSKPAGGQWVKGSPGSTATTVEVAPAKPPQHIVIKRPPPTPPMTPEERVKNDKLLALIEDVRSASQAEEDEARKERELTPAQRAKRGEALASFVQEQRSKGVVFVDQAEMKAALDKAVQ